MEHEHRWVPSGKIAPHTDGDVVIYMKCSSCGQKGFRRPGSKVIYTWVLE